MKETIMKLITWASGSATVLAILKLIPIIFGAAGAMIWFVIAVYKLMQARKEYKLSSLQLQQAEDKSQKA